MQVEVMHVEFPGVNYKRDQQKSHIVQGSPFLNLVFSTDVTHFYVTALAMALDFSKTTLETSVEYLQRHFLNHPTCCFPVTDYW